MTSLPLVSCLMPAYNRCPHDQILMEEAIQSFLLQDYPHKQLIIVYDTPGQSVEVENYRNEGIQVHNLPVRFSVLGLKIRYAIDESDGELLCRWDDDDISLPWRLSMSVRRIQETKAMAWNPTNYWYHPPGQYHEDIGHGNTHISGIFRREVLNQIGGYPIPAQSGHEDQAFNAACRSAKVPLVEDRLTREDMFYVYRWGVQTHHHLSGCADASQMQKSYDDLGERPIQSGTFSLRPHWREDYVRRTESQW